MVGGVLLGFLLGVILLAIAAWSTAPASHPGASLDDVYCPCCGQRIDGAP